MKQIILFFALLLSTSSMALEEVHHPVPKVPIYVTQDWYGELKAQLSPPPNAGSLSQRRDEGELLSEQKSRTSSDCDRAKSEVLVSVQSFFGAPYGPLSGKEVEALTPFFEQVRNDADFFIQKLKKEYPRQRPFKYVKGLSPCVALEVTNAYPSGHSVLAELYGRILSDIYPSKREVLMKRASQIAQDRVLSGMHHPSDIESGKKIGEVIYGKFAASKSFRGDLKKASVGL